MDEKRFGVFMTTSTQATPRGPKHRARTPRWPRLTALAASASMISLLTAGSLTLQPATAMQDATTPADVNLMPDPATCDNFGCSWDFVPANDAYSFILARDSIAPGGMLIVETQSAEVIPGLINTWSARLVDPNRIVIIDFMNGTPRVWTNGAIALQASPSPNEPATLNPLAIDWLQQLPQPISPSLVGHVRVRQVFVPTIASKTLLAPTEAEVAQLGDDISAIGRIKFNEPVTGFAVNDLTLTPMSEGCRIDSVSDVGDHYNFDILIRGCTSMWMSLSLQPWAVMGNAVGPASEVFLGPTQPRLTASMSAQPAPTATPTAMATPAPTVTPPATATPTPTVTPTLAPEPVAQTSQPEPTAAPEPAPSADQQAPMAEQAAEPAAPNSEQVAPTSEQAAETVEEGPAPSPVPARASAAGPQQDEDTDAAAISEGGPSDGGTPLIHDDGALKAVVANNSSAESASQPQWIVPVAAGLATVAGLVGAGALAQRIRARANVRLPRRRPVGFGAA